MIATESVVSGSTADGDGGHEIIEPNSRVLLSIEPDYTIAELDPFWQWCGTDQETKALRSAHPIVITGERLQITF
jgi:hypothetical protein